MPIIKRVKRHSDSSENVVVVDFSGCKSADECVTLFPTLINNAEKTPEAIAKVLENYNSKVAELSGSEGEKQNSLASGNVELGQQEIPAGIIVEDDMMPDAPSQDTSFEADMNSVVERYKQNGGLVKQNSSSNQGNVGSVITNHRESFSCLFK